MIDIFLARTSRNNRNKPDFYESYDDTPNTYIHSQEVVRVNLTKVTE